MATRKKKPVDSEVTEVLRIPDKPQESAKEATMTEPTQFVPEPRMTTFVRGAKIGAMKTGANKMAGFIATPIKDAVIPKLREQFPNAIEFIDPALQLTLECMIMLGAAELASMAGSLIPSEKKDENVKRGEMIAKFLREYAGEKAGTKLVEVAMAALPLILAQFSMIATKELEELTSEPPVEEVQATQEEEVGA